MAKRNTSPVSGTRDFLPLEVLRRRYVVDIIESVYQSYGFEPLETPAMERLETLLGKYGEEGDQLIFRILKRGEKLDRELRDRPAENDLADSGLRYDLTVPLARVAAQYQMELPRIFKRYQVQPVFRADRPAKGRFREFFQCDLDVVGSSSLLVEAELLGAASEVLERLGFAGGRDYRIRLNHRAVLRALMEAAGLGVEREETALVAVDKLDKIGRAGVEQELIERGLPRETVARLVDWLENRPSGNPETISWLRERVESFEHGRRGIEELGEVLRYVGGGAAESCVDLDPFLARGLSYYTGPIFEINFEGFSGSAGGGGRYDDLIGLFSGRQVPASGISLGLERILLILDERGLFPERLTGQPQVLATLFAPETIAPTLQLAHRLRESGLRVDVYPEPGKYGKQFKYADQRHIRFAVLLSPREIAQDVVTVKDLTSGEQVELATEKAAGWLLERL
ncbi:MAG: histidine--tRNA ligase [Acidobacteriota bacterium]